MKKSVLGLGLGLVLLSGCATTTSAPAANMNGDDMSAGMRVLHWIPNVILNFYDIFEANIGMDGKHYPFGARAQATKLLQLGVFESADFELFGINAGLHGEGKEYWNEWNKTTDYDVNMMVGVGAGAMFGIDLYQTYDFLACLVTLNLWTPEDDHMHHDDADDDDHDGM